MVVDFLFCLRFNKQIQNFNRCNCLVLNDGNDSLKAIELIEEKMTFPLGDRANQTQLKWLSFQKR